MVGVRVTPAQVTIPRAVEALDGGGKLVRAEDRRSVQRLARELAGSLEGAKAA